MQSNIMLGVPKSRLRLDPRTKILMTASVSIVLISGGVIGYDMIARIMLAILPAVLLISEGRLKSGFLYSVVFLTASFAESVLLMHTKGISSFVILICSGLITRFVPGLIAGYYLLSTTTVSEFNCAMKRMYLTDKIIIPLSVMFRFIPTIIEESQSINTAMMMRGIKRSRIFRSPVLYLEYKIVPLLMSVVKIGEELTAASLTKGLGSEIKRTNICKIGFHLADIIIASISLTGLLLYIIN
ncbi:energy-coupling factor transporter transmembrane component T [Clostridium boliviensis]|uniref:Energy-coupling factor transporter transmembrane component T n=1 Tax=Clostridium boliviensis TaxID=318465 RepID=A0ABU4GT87_9CLOT|nr:energy-coupling factor transporter transmembrane component T [Clostridium boliviensis]MDW2800853.1 energy-coupling factor transporter transmembrane component T [Clostridium boliviensis]